MSNYPKTKFVAEVKITDPDTGNECYVEIHKDPVSGGMFGVDSTYLDSVTEYVISPFSTSENITILDMEDNGM